MVKTVLSAENIVDFIEDIFRRRGADSYLGEQVSMSEHMLQGAYLAEQAGSDDELVAAILLHDIGHYTNEFPDDILEKGQDNYHQSAGAAVLQEFFPERVVDCVRGHVAAKRYLCAVDEQYFDRLSEASVHTLKLQGGPMSPKEAAEFARQPYLADIIQVRFWDEAGKVAGAKTPDFSHYIPLLRRLVAAEASKRGG